MRSLQFGEGVFGESPLVFIGASGVFLGILRLFSLPEIRVGLLVTCTLGLFRGRFEFGRVRSQTGNGACSNRISKLSSSLFSFCNSV